MIMNNEYDAAIETIIAISNDILDTEDPAVQGKMLTILDEKITKLNAQISASNNRGNFHTGHTDILRTLLHEIRVDMQRNHNEDGKCVECALHHEFFSIAAYGVDQAE